MQTVSVRAMVRMQTVSERAMVGADCKREGNDRCIL